MGAWRHAAWLQSLAPWILAPRLGAMLHGTKLRHVDSRGATSDASWRQDTWRHDVVAWRHGPWRQDEGPFFEIFPSGAYLRESFKKRAKKQKRRGDRHGRY
jgi:hypothetical protein